MQPCAGAVNKPDLTRTPGATTDPREAYRQEALQEEIRRQEIHLQEKAEFKRETDLAWLTIIAERCRQAQCQQQVWRGMQTMQQGMKQIDQRIGTLSKLAHEYESLLCRSGITLNTAYFDAARRYGSIRQALLKLNQQYDHLDLQNRNLPLSDFPSVSIDNYPALGETTSVQASADDSNTKALINPVTNLPTGVVVSQTPAQMDPELPHAPTHSHVLPNDPMSSELRQNKVQTDSLFFNFRQDLQRLQAIARKKEKNQDMASDLPEDIRTALGLFRHFERSLDTDSGWKETQPGGNPSPA